MVLTIACASDIHGKWEDIEWPKADILVIAGDILHNHGFERTYDAKMQIRDLAGLNNFLYWKKQEGIYKEVVVVAGNHDFAFSIRNEEAREQLKDVIYLQDEEAIVEGLNFYGSPWQPWFYDWAFNFPNHHENFFRARAHARICWDRIPKDTEVLVTHGPPFQVLDLCCDGREVGCVHLRDKIDELDELKLHVFGHIHYSYGQKIIKPLDDNPVRFVNAAVCRESYKPDNPIQVVKVEL